MDESKTTRAIPDTTLPADLPENWTYGQTVSPGGTETGLTKQHGYNYLMQQVNAAQGLINQVVDYLKNMGPVETDVVVRQTEEPPSGNTLIWIDPDLEPQGIDYEADMAKKADLVGGKVPASQLPPMDYVPNSEKGAANGVATLDGSGKLVGAQKPAYTASEVGAIANPAGGAAGQVLTKTADGAAWEDAPQTGITQEQADARYLQLSGGTMTGDIQLQNCGLVEARSLSLRGDFRSYARLSVASATLDLYPTLNLSSSQSGSRPMYLNGIASPERDNHAANKAYVDSKGVIYNGNPVNQTVTFHFGTESKPDEYSVTIPVGQVYSFNMSSGLGEKCVISYVDSNPSNIVHNRFIVLAQDNVKNCTGSYESESSIGLTPQQFAIIPC